MTTATDKRRANNTTAAEAPADNLLALIHVFSSLIDRAFYEPLQKRHGVSTAEWRIVLSLYQQPGATAAQIVDRWAMEKMAASRAIRDLEARGWVARRQRSKDRRSYALNLTPQGRKACESILPAANSRYREVVAGLSRPDAKRFEGDLAKLIAHTRGLAS